MKLKLIADWQERLEWILCCIAQGFCEPVIKPNKINGILNEFFKEVVMK